MGVLKLIPTISQKRNFTMFVTLTESFWSMTQWDLPETFMSRTLSRKFSTSLRSLISVHWTLDFLLHLFFFWKYCFAPSMILSFWHHSQGDLHWAPWGGGGQDGGQVPVEPWPRPGRHHRRGHRHHCPHPHRLLSLLPPPAQDRQPAEEGESEKTNIVTCSDQSNNLWVWAFTLRLSINFQET